MLRDHFARPVENKDNMKYLTVVAVALAAGLTSFAANAQGGAVKASKTIITQSKKTAKIEEKKADECPYLFGCSKKAEIDTFTTASIAGKGARNIKDQAQKAAYAATATKATGKPYGEIVARYASAYGVPVSLAHAVISVESNYRPNTRGRAGEIGLMQIKPATARMMGYSGSSKGLFNPETNIKFGMLYLAKAHELSGGTTCGTILKYNAGHGAKRMNPVSAAYCKKVQARIGG